MQSIYLNYLIVIVLGLIVGSFLNVVIWRFDELKSIINGRSHCPKCKAQLNWFDLIPVLSYVFLWGRCRYCQREISVQYPLVEAGTALVFALFLWKFGPTSTVFYFYLAISAILVVIFTYDILKLQISDFLVILAASLWLIYLLVSYFILHTSYSILLDSLYGAVALGGFIGLLVLLSREKWMGAGDIGLGALLGALVGWPTVLVAAFFAFVLGGIVGLILIALKKKELQSQVPFAPFLITGTLTALFWGAQIWQWYIGGLV